MISIIIPTLNEEKHLPKLLESIKMQQVPCEIIVADANSKDRTNAIARKYGCKLIQGGLPSKARNAGAAVAKNNIILFLDADAELPPGFLNHSLEHIQKHNLEVAGTYILPRSKKVIDRTAYHVGNLWMNTFKRIKPYAHGICIFSTKRVHEKIGGFDETITFGEDGDYVNRASNIAKFGMIKMPVLTSVRRFDKEGRIKSLFKYARLNLHRAVKGEIRKDVNYKFGHYD